MDGARALKRIGMVAATLSLLGCDAVDPFARSKDVVRAALRNGETAKFQNLNRCGRSNIVKGEVNAENVYGGFTGFQMFLEEDGEVAIDEGPPEKMTALLVKCTAATNAETARIAGGGAPR